MVRAAVKCSFKTRPITTDGSATAAAVATISFSLLVTKSSQILDHDKVPNRPNTARHCFVFISPDCSILSPASRTALCCASRALIEDHLLIIFFVRRAWGGRGGSAAQQKEQQSVLPGFAEARLCDRRQFGMYTLAMATSATSYILDVN